VKREQMEHILRAAAAITQERDFVVVGSQSLLAAVPNLSPPLDQSMELDLYPLNNPSAAELIDGTIGELSPFDETFGCYAHGVAPETAILPERWRERAIIVENENTGGARGICIGPVDLAISKLAAGREKDVNFVSAMLRQGLLTEPAIMAILPELNPIVREAVNQQLKKILF
jgi:hypothetical protein